ncbi:hypothetical protein BZA77DRAFT_295759 [Pyronema omphalodes]|nr:hypothetical protein BZA77DRAFT_295759 [Pyronema omphalodes]
MRFYLRRQNRAKQSENATSNAAAQHHTEHKYPSSPMDPIFTRRCCHNRRAYCRSGRTISQDKQHNHRNYNKIQDLLLVSIGKLIASPMIAWVQFEHSLHPYLPINEDQYYLVKPAANRDVQITVSRRPR